VRSEDWKKVKMLEWENEKKIGAVPGEACERNYEKN